MILRVFINSCESLLTAGGDGTCLAKQALFEYDKADVLRRLVCRHSRQMAVSLTFTDVRIMYTYRNTYKLNDTTMVLLNCKGI